MAKNEPPRISSMSEFIEWVNQLGFGNYLFRGVPNAEYSIQASAYRRPKEEDKQAENFIQINIGMSNLKNRWKQKNTLSLSMTLRNRRSC